MKNKYLSFTYIFIGFSFFCGKNLYAQIQIQRAIYSQYMFNPIVNNPSWSATQTQARATADSRFQWVGFDGAPKTYSFSIYTPLANEATSIGLSVINDKIGVEQEASTSFMLAQRVKLNDKSYLSAGLTAGIGLYSGNFNSLTTVDPVFVSDREWKSNVGIGVSYFTKNLYLGLSIPYTYQFNVSGSTNRESVASDYYFMGSYQFEIAYNLKLKPVTFVRYAKGQPLLFDANLGFFVGQEGHGVWLGAGYRSNAAVNAMFQVDLTKDLQLGYSADFATTKLYKRQSGTHEITLNYKFNIFNNKNNSLF